MRYLPLFIILNACFLLAGCDNESNGKIYYNCDEFIMGADLSYVNQILDHGGTYRENGKVKDPYKIFKDHGNNLVRLRLWNNPSWIYDVYNDSTKTLYSGFDDVKTSIQKSHEQGMKVCLDFHYSDVWADPHKQEAPKAWQSLVLNDLIDSLYTYTYQTLFKLNESGLLPEYVQVGNEINPGMIFPYGSINTYGWKKLGVLLDTAMQAVQDISKLSGQDIQVIIHIAQPENIEKWFDNILPFIDAENFDIIGLSYYSKWSDVPLYELGDYITTFRTKYNKKVVVVETAYLWTQEGADSYNNIIADSVEGYPISTDNQLKYMVDLTQQVINGGGQGVIYWEPAWISSEMKDLWNSGSAWENCTFFDFNNNNNLLEGIDFMTWKYKF